MQKSLSNQDIRTEAREARIPLWRIADKLNVCELTVGRKLRRELPEAEKAQIRAIISQLKEETQCQPHA